MKHTTCIFSVGLHGNEYTPEHAIEQVCGEIDSRAMRLFGEIKVVRGNPQALAQKKRYIDEDLNRLWTSERIAALECGVVPESRHVEEQALATVYNEFKPYLAAESGSMYHIDLHTTSGPSAAFCVSEYPGPGCSFARTLHLPFLRVSGDRYRGMLTRYIAQCGHISCLIEGGQEGLQETEDFLKSVCWIALFASGVLRAESFVGAQDFLSEQQDALKQCNAELPKELEMCYVHPVSQEDRFSMEPGYCSFQRVTRGETLARDRNGVITASEDAVILFPLYQQQGAEGFVLCREC